MEVKLKQKFFEKLNRATMKFRIPFLLLSILLLLPVVGISQTEFPDPPYLKSYKDVKGKVTKYNNFNYLDIRNEEEGTNRQAMGHYWELSYTYDSVFRQKRKFQDFIISQVEGQDGTVFFQDTMQVHFAIPSDNGNIWGRLSLSNDKLYRLRLIREVPFVNSIVFDTKPNIVFDKYVDSIMLPPRINFMPRSVITRTQISKYDHQEFTWNLKDTLYRQKVMGPFWDIKIEVRDSKNKVDKQVSSVEVLESYYRACVKAGGHVIKSRPRELLFTLPEKNAMMWVRITVSIDGVYFVRALLQNEADKSEPVKMVSVAPPVMDSTRIN
jgi:hypothetical protein